MKKAIICILIFSLTLSACTSKKQEPTLSPDEREDLYETAITAARSEEINKAFPLIDDADDDMSAAVFELLGITAADMTAYAISLSLMNVKAYALAAIYPAVGKENAVLDGLRAFVDKQVEAFDQYLIDQYEIAVNTRLETLEDGTILLVMGENQDSIFDAIKDIIERKA